MTTITNNDSLITPPFPVLPAAMAEALRRAELSAGRGEVPVGAVITNAAGEIIAADGNRMRGRADPTAHAEMNVLRSACAAYNGRLPEGFSLWVTLEPCPMCAQAISFARVSRLYFGAYDPKGGGTEHGARVFSQSSCFHIPDIYGGIAERRCAALLKDFFAAKRG